MFLKNSVSVMMCGLLFCLAVVVCDQEAPNENAKNNNSIQCEKDGIITLLMYKNIADSTATAIEHETQQPCDSFFISETEHRLVINNAIPLSVERMNNANFFFKGDFDGMPDEVILWTDYTYTSKSGVKRRDVLADRLRNNHGIANLIRIDIEDPGSAIGYLFCLDTDNENSGIGQLIISQENHADTVWIDAEKNTVCYPSLFEVLDLEFEDRGFMRDVQFSCPDRESFNYLDHGVVYFFTTDFNTEIIRIGTSWSFGGFLVDDLRLRLNMYAFVPEFPLVTSLCGVMPDVVKRTCIKAATLCVAHTLFSIISKGGDSNA